MRKPPGKTRAKSSTLGGQLTAKAAKARTPAQKRRTKRQAGGLKKYPGQVR